MAIDVKPGQMLQVTVKSYPRTAAAKKTLVRLFENDRTVERERKRLAKTRPPEPSRRGGRIWMNRPPRLEVVETTPGASYKIFGSVDVLRDLNSVEKFVDVKPA